MTVLLFAHAEERRFSNLDGRKRLAGCVCTDDRAVLDTGNPVATESPRPSCERAIRVARQDRAAVAGDSTAVNRERASQEVVSDPAHPRSSGNRALQRVTAIRVAAKTRHPPPVAVAEDKSPRDYGYHGDQSHGPSVSDQETLVDQGSPLREGRASARRVTSVAPQLSAV